jgi:hypothetical protein
MLCPAHHPAAGSETGLAFDNDNARHEVPSNGVADPATSSSAVMRSRLWLKKTPKKAGFLCDAPEREQFAEETAVT